MGELRRALTLISDICEGAGAVVLAVVIVINAIAVFTRYVLVDPIGWSEELMRYSLAWLTYLLVAPCLFRNEHMAMETLDVIRNEAIKRALIRTNLAVTFVFSISILWFAIPLLQRNWNQYTAVLEIRSFWPYLSVFLGCALLALYCVAMFILSFGREKLHRAEDA
jgi:TRAP-type C4-dicarboxylate transport system permease small subunit